MKQLVFTAEVTDEDAERIRSLDQATFDISTIFDKDGDTVIFDYLEVTLEPEQEA